MTMASHQQMHHRLEYEKLQRLILYGAFIRKSLEFLNKTVQILKTLLRFIALDDTS